MQIYLDPDKSTRLGMDGRTKHQNICVKYHKSTADYKYVYNYEDQSTNTLIYMFYYSKLTAKMRDFFLYSIFFRQKPSPDQVSSNKKKNYSNWFIRSEGNRFQTYIGTYIDRVAIV